MSFKNDILRLREEGRSYKSISQELKCSKGTIAFHCKNYNLQNIGLRDFQIYTQKQIKEINDFYKKSTLEETSLKFNIKKSKLKKLLTKKQILLTSEERKIRNYQKVKSRRQFHKEKAVEYKGGKCEICSYNKSIWAFDFHHTDPSIKDFNIGNFLILSWQKLKKELDKCKLLCANCHRELHHESFINK